ncbi:MAG TPA: hypothetical protein PKG48_03850 [Bacteroidales bacterium]|nr:hypothetical protein [Bacteroidales bacterium]
MRPLKYLILIPVLLFLVTSCTVYKKTVPTSPISTQVNLTMEDLEYLGEVTGTSTQSYFLFIPYGGDKNVYAAALMGSGRGLLNLNGLANSRGFNNALYKALMQKRDADFVMPLSMEVTTHKMFLGKEETITVTAKAYRIITK